MRCGKGWETPKIGAMARVKTSFLGRELSGSVGNVAFRRTSSGTQMVERSRGRDPQTPAQRAARDRMRRAGQAWLSLSLEEAEAWREYARRLAPSALVRPPQAVNVFKTFATRVLAVNPLVAIPVLPPSAPFGGDAVRVTVQAVQGGIAFVPDGSNATGVVTELLVQALASPHRAAYPERYRSQGFLAFTGEPVVVPTGAGWHAVAVRFVRAATGQATPLLELGRVRVA